MKINRNIMVMAIGLLFLATDEINAQDVEGTQDPIRRNGIKSMRMQYPSEITSAIVSQSKGKYDEAIQSYRVAIEKYPNTVNVPIAYAGIGSCYKVQGKDVKARKLYQRAIPLFEKIVASSDRKEIAYYQANQGLAAISIQLEDWRGAIQYLSRLVGPEATAIFGEREVGSYYMSMGEAYEKQEKGEDAISAYGQALEYFTNVGGPPSSISTAHSRLGECYIKLQNWEAARREYQIQIDMAEKFLKDNPDLPESRREKISQMIEAGRIKMANLGK